MAGLVGNPLAKAGYKTLAKAVKGKEAVNAQFKLSRAASLMLKSYMTPFSQEVMMASLPRPPCQPTFKVKGFVRGVCVIGLASTGYVAIAPCICNDQPFIYYTTAAYGLSNTSTPPSDLTLAASAAGGATYPAWVACSNLPYSSAQLTTTTGVTNSASDISGRIVSVGLRTEYTGTVFQQSGQFYAYNDPDTNNVLGGDHVAAAGGSGYYTATLAQKDACEIRNIGQTRTMMLSALSTDDNMDDFPRQNSTYYRKAYPYSSGEYYNTADVAVGNVPADPAGAATAVIMFTGVPGQTVYFEGVIHVEYLGAGVNQSLLSETSTDVVGYDTTKGLIARAQRRMSGSQNLSLPQAIRIEMKKEKVTFGNGLRSK